MDWVNELRALDEVLELIDELGGDRHAWIAALLVVKAFILLLLEL